MNCSYLIRACIDQEAIYLRFIACCLSQKYSIVRKQPRLKQLLRFSRALQTSRVLHIPKLARWLMNQLLNFISFVTTGR